MFRGCLFIALSLLSSWALAQQASTLSPSGVQGALTFQATVFMPASVSNTDANVLALINLQTEHLIGLFDLPQFAQMNNITPAGLGFMGLGPLEIYKILGETKTPDGIEISYQIRQRVMVMKNILQPGDTQTLKLILPRDPVEIYSPGCTDQQFSEKEYFFSHWNPFLPNCHESLTGKNQVDTVTATLEILTEPSTETAPDYVALAQQMRIRQELHISLLFGFDINSPTTHGEGQQNYNDFLKYFDDMGFQVDRARNTPPGPYADLIKPGATGLANVDLSVSLSASDPNNPIAFAKRARQAFETSDIVLYLGNPGLGGNLDVATIARMSSPDPQNPLPIRFPNAYQIFYFDSSNSYYLYAQQYTMGHQGLYRVDVVTNATPTYFESQQLEATTFLNFFINPKPSADWLGIMTAIETADKGLTYLINVSPVN